MKSKIPPRPSAIGIVGLGIMGSAIAQHLIQAGHRVIGYDVRTARLRDLRAARGVVAKDSAAVQALMQSLDSPAVDKNEVRTIIAAIGITTDRQTIKNLISFYLDDPVTALSSSLALIYNPPLLDILPIYVAFMVLSPWILMFGLRVSWKPVIVASIIVWLCAQFGLEKEAYQAARDFAGLKVPFHEIGSFDVLAWQLVWVIGLWMGAKVAVEPLRLGKLSASLVYLALAVALTGFLTRHMFGQAPFGDHTSLLVLINKWHLGPLRLLNFMALLILTLRFGPNIKNAIRWRFLEVLGAASLPVFCVHLAVVLLALALIGDKQGATPVWQEIILLAVTFLAMYGTAWVFRAEPQSGTAQEAGDPPAVSARVVR